MSDALCLGTLKMVTLLLFIISFQQVVCDVIVGEPTFGFPTAQFLLESKFGFPSEITPEYERTLQSVTKTDTQGFAYYQFFSGPLCTGNLTYSSGIPAGVCLPAVEYDVPGEYYFYGDLYNKTYQSFYINNIQDNCQDTEIVFFKDNACDIPLYQQPLSNANPHTNNQIFTSCYNNLNPASNMLVSYIGKCSIESIVPVSVDSYVYSEYNSTQRCEKTPSFFEAYSLNVCFGFSNHSSTSFSCSSNSDNVTMNQFYDNRMCVVNPLFDLQTNLTIATGCYSSSTKISPKKDQYSFQKAQCIIIDGTTSSDNNYQLSTAAIVGIVVGSVVVVAMIASLAAYFVFGSTFISSKIGKRANSFDSDNDATNIVSSAANPLVNKA